MSENLIEIRNLSFRRGDRLIFDGIDLDVPRGKITGIMGPSGTGKTTLLRLIGGQLRPDAGTVEVAGQNVGAMGRAQLFSFRRNLGMLFQSSALFTDLTVFENVAFPLRVHTDLSADTIRDLVLMKLNAVGLRGARDLMPAQLSGGMARRVALARAIALDPDLLMFDEPFTGQDPIALGVLVDLINNLNEATDTTCLVVSHDIHETTGISDHLIVIADGQVIGSGTPASMRERETAMVHQFMHGEPDGPVPFHYPADEYAYDLLGDAGVARRRPG